METAFALAVVIGLTLGLLGGGGSVLTVPMLVFWLHVEPKSAIAVSFVVVGLSSLLAMLPHARRRAVCWKSGLFFGAAGMCGAFAGGRAASQISGEALLSLFGLVCLLTGVLMLRRRPGGAANRKPVRLSVCPLQAPYFRLLFDGLLVGGLTGMVGVGGGFLIVPALTLMVGIPMPGAVGTSLLVVVMNALAGLAGYSRHAALDWHLTSVVASGSVCGALIGAWLSVYFKPAWLRALFGGMVTAVAVYTLSQALTWDLLQRGLEWLETPGGAMRAGAGLGLAALLAVLGFWIHRWDPVRWTPAPGD